MEESRKFLQFNVKLQPRRHFTLWRCSFQGKTPHMQLLSDGILILSSAKKRSLKSVCRLSDQSCLSTSCF